MKLLDVNVLIALCDADHVHHDAARKWFRSNRAGGWATCPITENGLLRVMGSPRYPGGLGSPDAVRPLLQQLRSTPGHVFWEGRVSLADSVKLPTLRGVPSGQLTDVYLLVQAVDRGGQLATLDTRIDAARVPGGLQALEVVPR